MKYKATLHLIPQGNTLQSGPALPKYIKSTLWREVEIPACLIQKGVVLAFEMPEFTFHVVIKVINYSFSKSSTDIVCTYCVDDFTEIGMFNKQDYFDKLVQNLIADGWQLPQGKN